MASRVSPPRAVPSVTAAHRPTGLTGASSTSASATPAPAAAEDAEEEAAAPILLPGYWEGGGWCGCRVGYDVYCVTYACVVLTSMDPDAGVDLRSIDAAKRDDRPCLASRSCVGWCGVGVSWCFWGLCKARQRRSLLHRSGLARRLSPKAVAVRCVCSIHSATQQHTRHTHTRLLTTTFTHTHHPTHVPTQNRHRISTDECSPPPSHTRHRHVPTQNRH